MQSSDPRALRVRLGGLQSHLQNQVNNSIIPLIVQRGFRQLPGLFGPAPLDMSDAGATEKEKAAPHSRAFARGERLPSPFSAETPLCMFLASVWPCAGRSLSFPPPRLVRDGRWSQHPPPLRRGNFKGGAFILAPRPKGNTLGGD